MNKGIVFILHFSTSSNLVLIDLLTVCPYINSRQEAKLLELHSAFIQWGLLKIDETKGWRDSSEINYSERKVEAFWISSLQNQNDSVFEIFPSDIEPSNGERAQTGTADDAV